MLRAVDRPLGQPRRSRYESARATSSCSFLRLERVVAPRPSPTCRREGLILAQTSQSVERALARARRAQGRAHGRPAPPRPLPPASAASSDVISCGLSRGRHAREPFFRSSTRRHSSSQSGPISRARRVGARAPRSSEGATRRARSRRSLARCSRLGSSEIYSLDLDEHTSTPTALHRREGGTRLERSDPWSRSRSRSRSHATTTKGGKPKSLGRGHNNGEARAKGRRERDAEEEQPDSSFSPSRPSRPCRRRAPGACRTSTGHRHRQHRAGLRAEERERGRKRVSSRGLGRGGGSEARARERRTHCWHRHP